jgi:hypothetical protein
LGIGDSRIAAVRGKKLYAVRDSKGQFKDIQSYARTHSQDIRKKSASERKSK